MFAKSGPSRNRNSRWPGRAVLLDDVGAGDVGGHQVGRELDAAERQIQRAGQRADQQRLGQPRHAFEHAVPAAEQADQQLLDDLVLADDHLRQLLADAVDGRAELFNHLAVGQCIRGGSHAGLAWSGAGVSEFGSVSAR